MLVSKSTDQYIPLRVNTYQYMPIHTNACHEDQYVPIHTNVSIHTNPYINVPMRTILSMHTNVHQYITLCISTCHYIPLHTNMYNLQISANMYTIWHNICSLYVPIMYYYVSNPAKDTYQYIPIHTTRANTYQYILIVSIHTNTCINVPIRTILIPMRINTYPYVSVHATTYLYMLIHTNMYNPDQNTCQNEVAILACIGTYWMPIRAKTYLILTATYQNIDQYTCQNKVAILACICTYCKPIRASMYQIYTIYIPIRTVAGEKTRTSSGVVFWYVLACILVRIENT